MPTRHRRPPAAPHLDPLKWIESAINRRGSNVERYERQMRSWRRQQRLKGLLQRWLKRLRSVLGLDDRQRHARRMSATRGDRQQRR